MLISALLFVVPIAAAGGVRLETNRDCPSVAQVRDVVDSLMDAREREGSARWKHVSSGAARAGKRFSVIVSTRSSTTALEIDALDMDCGALAELVALTIERATSPLADEEPGQPRLAQVVAAVRSRSDAASGAAPALVGSDARASNALADSTIAALGDLGAPGDRIKLGSAGTIDELDSSAIVPGGARPTGASAPYIAGVANDPRGGLRSTGAIDAHVPGAAHDPGSGARSTGATDARLGSVGSGVVTDSAKLAGAVTDGRRLAAVANDIASDAVTNSTQLGGVANDVSPGVLAGGASAGDTADDAALAPPLNAENETADAALATPLAGEPPLAASLDRTLIRSISIAAGPALLLSSRTTPALTATSNLWLDGDTFGIALDLTATLPSKHASLGAELQMFELDAALGLSARHALWNQLGAGLSLQALLAHVRGRTSGVLDEIPLRDFRAGLRVAATLTQAIGPLDLRLNTAVRLLPDRRYTVNPNVELARLPVAEAELGLLLAYGWEH